MHTLPPPLLSIGNNTFQPQGIQLSDYILTARQEYLSTTSDDESGVWSDGRIEITGNHQHNLPRSLKNKIFHTASS